MSEKVCFACLQIHHVDNLCSLHAHDEPHLDKIKFLLGTTLITCEDMAVCKKCSENLNRCCDFKKLLVETQNTLRDLQRASSKPFKLKLEHVRNRSENERGVVKTESLDLKDELDTCASSGEDVDEVPTVTERRLRSGSKLCLKQDDDDDKVIKNEISKKKSSKYKHECSMCGSFYERRWQLQRHESRAHSTDKNHECSYCQKTFKQSHHLQAHLATHTKGVNFVCNICGKTYGLRSSYTRHLNSHEAPPGQKSKRTPFLCTICGKSFPFSNGRTRHMRIHQGIRKYECKVCNKKFMQSTHLITHMRVHTGERPFICHVCGKTFAFKVCLSKHITTHPEDGE